MRAWMSSATNKMCSGHAHTKRRFAKHVIRHVHGCGSRATQIVAQGMAASAPFAGFEGDGESPGSPPARAGLLPAQTVAAAGFDNEDELVSWRVRFADGSEQTVTASRCNTGSGSSGCAWVPRKKPVCMSDSEFSGFWRGIHALTLDPDSV
jgi:hypothetical protein